MRFLSFSLLLSLPALAQGAPEVAPTDPHWLAKMLVANLLPVVITVLTPLLMAALAYLTGYLRNKSAESNAAKVSLLFAEAASSIVAELNATLKPKLLKALEDGVLTETEKAQLKAAALEALKTKLPASLIGSAQGLFGGFVDSWLAGLVERAVESQKAPAAAPLAAAPAASP